MKNKQVVYVMLILSLFQLKSYSQSIEIKTVNDIYLNTPDSVLYFQISRIPLKESKLDMEKRYYWYKSGTFSSNRGSYAGFLLDGKYCVYDNIKKLREEGYFCKGLKVGKWKRWHPNGEYESVTVWKDGFKRGRSLYYSPAGTLLKSIDYNKDVIDGYVILYLGSRVEKLKYDKGVLIRPTVKSVKKGGSLFSRIFKKDTLSRKKEAVVNVKKDTLKKSGGWFNWAFKRTHKTEKKSVKTSK